MTFPAGDADDNPREGTGEGPSQGAHEAPPIEQSPTSGFDVPPSADYQPPAQNAGYYGPQGGGPAYPPPSYPPPPPPGYGAYPPPPQGYGQPYSNGYPVTDYSGGYGQPVPAGTNTLAIASLVLAGVGLLCGIGSIVGIVLGVIALNQIKQTHQAGRGLAIAGIAVGAGSMLISLLFVVPMLMS